MASTRKSTDTHSRDSVVVQCIFPSPSQGKLTSPCRVLVKNTAVGAGGKGEWSELTQDILCLTLCATNANDESNVVSSFLMFLPADLRDRCGGSLPDEFVVRDGLPVGEEAAGASWVVCLPFTSAGRCHQVEGSLDERGRVLLSLFPTTTDCTVLFATPLDETRGQGKEPEEESEEIVRRLFEQRFLSYRTSLSPPSAAGGTHGGALLWRLYCLVPSFPSSLVGRLGKYVESVLVPVGKEAFQRFQALLVREGSTPLRRGEEGRAAETKSIPSCHQVMLVDWETCSGLSSLTQQEEERWYCGEGTCYHAPSRTLLLDAAMVQRVLTISGEETLRPTCPHQTIHLSLLVGGAIVGALLQTLLPPRRVGADDDAENVGLLATSIGRVSVLHSIVVAEYGGMHGHPDVTGYLSWLASNTSQDIEPVPWLADPRCGTSTPARRSLQKEYRRWRTETSIARTMLSLHSVLLQGEGMPTSDTGNNLRCQGANAQCTPQQKVSKVRVGYTVTELSPNFTQITVAASCCDSVGMPEAATAQHGGLRVYLLVLRSPLGEPLPVGGSSGDHSIEELAFCELSLLWDSSPAAEGSVTIPHTSTDGTGGGQSHVLSVGIAVDPFGESLPWLLFDSFVPPIGCNGSNANSALYRHLCGVLDSPLQPHDPARSNVLHVMRKQLLSSNILLRPGGGVGRCDAGIAVDDKEEEVTSQLSFVATVVAREWNLQRDPSEFPYRSCLEKVTVLRLFRSVAVAHLRQAYRKKESRTSSAIDLLSESADEDTAEVKDGSEISPVVTKAWSTFEGCFGSLLQNFYSLLTSSSNDESRISSPLPSENIFLSCCRPHGTTGHAGDCCFVQELWVTIKALSHELRQCLSVFSTREGNTLPVCHPYAQKLAEGMDTFLKAVGRHHPGIQQCHRANIGRTLDGGSRKRGRSDAAVADSLKSFIREIRDNATGEVQRSGRFRVQLRRSETPPLGNAPVVSTEEQPTVLNSSSFASRASARWALGGLLLQ